mmetsp:Transcript_41020/g.55899  ORF Transcript_41020/g.55899 Transcript_41020/m.55899 type:complete len:112 (-) Transcript_41020:286-621(-)
MRAEEDGNTRVREALSAAHDDPGVELGIRNGVVECEEAEEAAAVVEEEDEDGVFRASQVRAICAGVMFVPFRRALRSSRDRWVVAVVEAGVSPKEIRRRSFNKSGGERQLT